jgi:hypothetical protein
MQLFTSEILAESCGWSGAICVLLAYYFISTGKVHKENRWYHMGNLVGAVLLIYNTLYLKAYPSAFVNVIWCFIALAGLLGKKNQSAS